MLPMGDNVVAVAAAAAALCLKSQPDWIQYDTLITNYFGLFKMKNCFLSNKLV